MSKAEEAEAVAEGIVAAGGKARAFRLDVADAEAVAAFFKDEIKDKVELDVLVNNAGITRDGLILRMKDEDFDCVIQTNLRGAFVCVREAAKIMSRQRRGRIVNISSVVGQMGNAGQIDDASAKAGLIGLTKSAAKELAGRNVTVNAVAPGFVETDMTAALPDDVRAGLRGGHSAQTPRHPAGHRRHGGLSGLAGSRIHHRAGHRRQRRHVLLISADSGPALCRMPLQPCRGRMGREPYSSKPKNKTGRISPRPLKNRLKKIIMEQLATAEEVKPEASFVEDLGADSLDLTELIMAMEEAFDVEIADDDAQDLKVKDYLVRAESHELSLSRLF